MNSAGPPFDLLGFFLGMLGLILLLLAFALPNPQTVVLLAAPVPLACLGLAALRPKQYTLGGPEGESRYPLSLAISWSTAAMIVASARQFHHVEFAGPFWLMVCGSLVVGSLVGLFCRRLDQRGLHDGTLTVIVSVLAAGWIAGSLLQVNAFTSRPATRLSALVSEKWISTGRRGGRTFWLSLYTGPGKYPWNVDVSHSAYRAAAVGERVCIVDRVGVLRVTWWTVGACQRA
jgi:hypothetical protein